MIVAVGLLTLAAAAGTVLTYAFDPELPFGPRVAAGTCVGLAALALAGIVAASLVGTTAGTLSATALMAGVVIVGVRRGAGAKLVRDGRALLPKLRSPGRAGARTAVYYLVFGVGLGALFSRAVFERPDGLYTGINNNYGDLMLHISAVTSFTEGNFPVEHPLWAGASYTYAFGADALTALLMDGGAGLEIAFWLQNMALALALLVLVRHLTHRLTGDRLATALTPVLLLLGSGVGFVRLVEDAGEGRGLVDTLGALPRDYSIEGGTVWRWGDALTTSLTTQRSFLLGLPLAILIFMQWWRATKADEPAGGRLRPMLATGAVAGALPLLHTFSFAVVLGAAIWLAVIQARLWRMWLAFFAVAALVSAPALLYLAGGDSEAGRFLSWAPGWDSAGENIVIFWLLNTGPFIPLLVAALLWRGSRPLVGKRLLLAYVPFALCFLVPNLIQFTPWIWDGSKVLFFWYLASVPLVALVLSRLWERRRGWRVAVAVTVVALTLSGSLDVWRAVSGASELRELDRGQIAFAELIAERTPQRAVVLHAPVHDHAVYLSGRLSVLGYVGHAFSWGLPYPQREQDIASIYAGDGVAGALLDEYGVDYVVVGPQERDPQSTTGMAINEGWIDPSLELVGRVGEQALYRVPPGFR